MSPSNLTARPTWLRFAWRVYIPKSFTVILREGYRLSGFRADDVAGIDVDQQIKESVGALHRFLKRCKSHGVAVYFSELRPRAREVLKRMGAFRFGGVHDVATYAEAPHRSACWRQFCAERCLMRNANGSNSQ